MSAFWKRMAVVDNNAALFERLVFCFWNPKRVSLTPFSEPFLNDFEKKFILDLANKWIDGSQHPQKWSKKQVGLIHRIHDKVSQANFKMKKGGGNGNG